MEEVIFTEIKKRENYNMIKRVIIENFKGMTRPEKC